MRGKAFLAAMLVIAAVIGASVYALADQRDSDLARIDAEFRQVTCDALGREVSGRISAVESGTLFSVYFDAAAVRGYYARTLPGRIRNRDAAIAEYARLCKKGPS